MSCVNNFIKKNKLAEPSSDNVGIRDSKAAFFGRIGHSRGGRSTDVSRVRGTFAEAPRGRSPRRREMIIACFGDESLLV